MPTSDTNTERTGPDNENHFDDANVGKGALWCSWQKLCGWWPVADICGFPVIGSSARMICSISNVLHIHESAMKSMGGWDDTTLKLMYSVALNYFALIKERKGFSETWS